MRTESGSDFIRTALDLFLTDEEVWFFRREEEEEDVYPCEVGGWGRWR